MRSRSRNIIVLLLFCFMATPALSKPRYAIAVHGGAGSAPKQFTEQQNRARHQGIAQALAAGEAVLKGDGTALDAVEAAIRILEDDPLFNAGRGAVLNDAGQAELDASIMNGADGSCGAAAGTTITKNPITLARAVMEHTRHVLLAADGADAFARERDLEIVARDYFITEGQKARWEKAKAKAGAKSGEARGASAGDGAGDPSRRIGTVGCVALDAAGNLAAGTSTGGLLMKKFGRVGDSPIVGAGTYANNATCAVSCTGVGEEFIRNAIAFDVHARMKYTGANLESAVKAQLESVLEPGQGGMIALDQEGKIVMDFNTGGMACGAANSQGLFEVRWPGGGE